MSRIYKGKFKDVSAICIDTSKFVAKFLPDFGGRLVSLVDLSGYEWMAQDKEKTFKPQTPLGSYIASEVGGFDDLFPTIDPQHADGSRTDMVYPCHGEVCRHPHTYSFTDSTLRTSYLSSAFQFQFDKEISVTDRGGLKLDYKIRNLSDEDFPCLWAAHFMMTAEPDSHGVFYYLNGNLTEIMFDETKKFGVAGDKIPFDRKLVSCDLNDSNSAYKFYFLNKQPVGKCGYYNAKRKKTLFLFYDRKKVQYLGVWVNNGGFKNSSCFALEPCTLPFDSPEKSALRGEKFTLAPHSECSFSFCISLE